MFKLISAFLSLLMDELIVAANVLDGAEMILFTSTGEINSNTVVGDLTQATFATYAAAPITWVKSFTSGGIPFLTSGPITFQPNAGTNLPQTVTGAGIIDSNGDLVAAGYFEEPVEVAVSGQQLHASVHFKLDGSQDTAFECYSA